MIYIHFTERQHFGQASSLYFSHPIDIIEASCIDEVLPALKRIESAIAKGYYVAGFISYEASPAFDNALHALESNDFPLLWFGIFQAPDTAIPTFKKKSYSVGEWTAQESYPYYAQQIKKIKDYLEKGIFYQINYTIRLHAPFSGSALTWYHDLNQEGHGQYGAYLETDHWHILSFSPELFFVWQDNHLITRPMKGTALRGALPDQEVIQQLLSSEKDRAENLMIVDLLRNDLSRLAVPGSVKVPQLFTVETYPTLFQMTSTITAETKPETTLTDIMKALFPCGSITGAPKIKATQIISQLENHPRYAYCGTIGYITPTGRACFNVAIRTICINQLQKKAIYGVGGAITWDSTPKGEWEEIRTKTKFLSPNVRFFS